MTANGSQGLAGLLGAASPIDALERLERGWRAVGVTEDAADARDRLRDLDAGLLMFVVGEGKFGKSSLVNALLGAQVAPVSLVPCTWKVDLYETARAEPHALLHWSDQDPERVTLERAREICEQEQADAEQRAGQRCRSRLRQVTWRLPHLHLPTDVALVDTPGFAQVRADLDLTRVSLRGARGIEVLAKEPFDYWYHRADVVLWVFKATKLTDRDTRDALEKLAPQGKRVLGVITHMDRVPEAERSAVVAAARQAFGAYVPDFVPVVTKAGHPDLPPSITGLRARLERDYFADVRTQKAAALYAFLVHSGTRLHDLATSITDMLERNRAILRKTVVRARDLVGRAERDLESQLLEWQTACERRATVANERGWRDIPAPGDDAGLQRELRRILGVEQAASELRATAGGICERLRADLVETCARCEFIGVRMSREGSETYVEVPDLTAAAADRDHQAAPAGKTGDVLTGSEGVGAGLLLSGIAYLALGPLGIAVGLLGLLFADEIRRQKLRKFTTERIAAWFRDSRATALADLIPRLTRWEQACQETLHAAFSRFSGLPVEEVPARVREYRLHVLEPLERRRLGPHTRLRWLLVPAGIAAALSIAAYQAGWTRASAPPAPATRRLPVAASPATARDLAQALVDECRAALATAKSLAAEANAIRVDAAESPSVTRARIHTLLNAYAALRLQTESPPSRRPTHPVPVAPWASEQFESAFRDAWREVARTTARADGVPLPDPDMERSRAGEDDTSLRQAIEHTRAIMQVLVERARHDLVVAYRVAQRFAGPASTPETGPAPEPETLAPDRSRWPTHPQLKDGPPVSPPPTPEPSPHAALPAVSARAPGDASSSPPPSVPEANAHDARPAIATPPPDEAPPPSPPPLPDADRHDAPIPSPPPTPDADSDATPPTAPPPPAPTESPLLLETVQAVTRLEETWEQVPHFQRPWLVQELRNAVAALPDGLSRWALEQRVARLEARIDPAPPPAPPVAEHQPPPAAPPPASVKPSVEPRPTDPQPEPNREPDPTLGVHLGLAQDVEMRFVKIPDGTATLGDADGGPDEARHTVRFDRPFWISRTEVTQAQWCALMRPNPSKHQGANLPVDRVSWDDALAFTQQLAPYLPGRTVTLPTCDEWEYACRAASADAWACGSDPHQLPPFAWFEDNGEDRTHPVDTRRRNAWDLADLHGNVSEWCATSRASPDGKVVLRAVMGGAYLHHASKLRAAGRDWLSPATRLPWVGFRVVVR